eukprot:scaffold2643_cov117-Isochrysis_galbana.AAC.2
MLQGVRATMAKVATRRAAQMVELRSHSPSAYLGHRGDDPPQADWRGDVCTGRQWWNLGCHRPGGDAGHAGPLSPDANTIGAAARPRQRPATLAGLAGEHAEWVTGTATAASACAEMRCRTLSPGSGLFTSTMYRSVSLCRSACGLYSLVDSLLG